MFNIIWRVYVIDINSTCKYSLFFVYIIPSRFYII
nr:MAG TPA: hypothetical protein [Caudoviricetes sp.]DAJ18226.1 MAG TPA: hypothetical protein [Podoviridae sp. ctY3D12]